MAHQHEAADDSTAQQLSAKCEDKEWNEYTTRFYEEMEALRRRFENPSPADPVVPTEHRDTNLAAILNYLDGKDDVFSAAAISTDENPSQLRTRTDLPGRSSITNETIGSAPSEARYQQTGPTSAVREVDMDKQQNRTLPTSRGFQYSRMGLQPMASYHTDTADDRTVARKRAAQAPMSKPISPKDYEQPQCSVDRKEQGNPGSRRVIPVGAAPNPAVVFLSNHLQSRHPLTAGISDCLDSDTHALSSPVIRSRTTAQNAAETKGRNPVDGVASNRWHSNSPECMEHMPPYRTMVRIDGAQICPLPSELARRATTNTTMEATESLKPSADSRLLSSSEGIIGSKREVDASANEAGDDTLVLSPKRRKRRTFKLLFTPEYKRRHPPRKMPTDSTLKRYCHMCNEKVMTDNDEALLAYTTCMRYKDRICSNVFCDTCLRFWQPQKYNAVNIDGREYLCMHCQDDIACYGQCNVYTLANEKRIRRAPGTAKQTAVEASALFKPEGKIRNEPIALNRLAEPDSFHGASPLPSEPQSDSDSSPKIYRKRRRTRAALTSSLENAHFKRQQ